MSHPLVVEAAERLFAPVAIRNNVDGYEKQVRERYEEPAWNNPVLRFLGGDGEDLIPRKDRVWSLGGVAGRMVAALAAAKRDVPAWLRLLADEHREGRRRASFAMHCFWEGEARLGAVDGVVAVRPGFRDGLETVEVTFLPDRVGYAALLAKARELDCASRVFALDDGQLEVARKAVGEAAVRADGEARPAKADDHLHGLRRAPLARLPMTEAQAMRVNATLAAGGDPLAWLSPVQQALARRLARLAKDDPKALTELPLLPPISGLQAPSTRLDGAERPRR